MSAATERLDALIDEYLRGNQAFMPFWSAFMDRWAAEDLSDEDAEAYEPAYDAVYMGGEDSISPEGRGQVLIGETEVKARLAEFRRLRTGASRA